jgi:hypothetical protein
MPTYFDTWPVSSNGLPRIQGIYSDLDPYEIREIMDWEWYIYISRYTISNFCIGYDWIKFKIEILRIFTVIYGFNYLVYRQLSANVMVVTTTLFAHTAFLWAKCCRICFIPIITPFLTHWSWLRLVPFIRLTAGVTRQQGMLTPPWHLITPLIYSEVRVRPFSDWYFL